MDKANLILNSTIELVDVQEEGNGKGRPFVSRFLEPGIAHYKELGDILITKETLNKFINTMVGCPVIIEHEDVTDENADKLRVGVVSRVWFNEMDGYFYCEGILTDPEAIDLVKNQGYNVSCAYSFVSDNTKKTHNGKEIDMEFIDGEFLHLALVKDPRYEGANIVVNSLVKNAKDWDGNEGDWITIKGNHLFIKKGQSKDEAVKEFLKGKQSESKDKSDESKGEPKDKHGFKKDKDSGYYMKDLPDGTSVYVEKKEGGQGEKEPFFLEATHFDENGKTLSKKQYHYDSMDGMFDKIDKDFVSKDKPGDGGKSFEELGQHDQESFMRELRGIYPVDAKDIHYEMPKLSQDDIQSILDKLEKEGRVVKKPIPNVYPPREGYTTQENIKFQEGRKKEKEQESAARKQASYDANKYEKLQKEYKDIKKHISQKQSAVDRASQQERLAEIREELEAMERNKPGDGGEKGGNIIDVKKLNEREQSLSYYAEDLQEAVDHLGSAKYRYKAGFRGEKSSEDLYPVIIKTNSDTSPYMVTTKGVAEKNNATIVKDYKNLNRPQKGDTMTIDTNWSGTRPRLADVKVLDKRPDKYSKDKHEDDFFNEYEYKVETSDGKKKWVTEKAIIGGSIKKQANNSIGDITMTVLNDLTDFIKKVVKNEKDEEMKEVKNEDKRKLIDEVGGILKGKVDEEVWRTIIGKLEKVAYKPSEGSKADNEDDEEKEAKNKCKNEDDKEEEEIEEKVTENEDEEEDKKEDKEDKAENKKVKNSMKDIVMGGSSQAQTQKLYTSRKERLEEGNKY